MVATVGLGFPFRSIMKIIVKLASVLLALVVPSATVSAAEKIVAGPKGGRLLDTKPLKAEFLVNAERKVEISFYDAALRPVAPLTQVVAVTAEPKAGRAKLDMEKAAHGFVSRTALPPGDETYRVVVQVRPAPDAAPQNFRVDLNLETCGECKLKEYACVCDH
jgi:hypothetical protein